VGARRAGRVASRPRSTWTSSGPAASSRPRSARSPRASPDACARRCAVIPVSETHALDHDEELAGLDLLELAGDTGESRSRRIWKATWPKVAAAVLGIGIWQLGVWSGWKPEFARAPPSPARH